MSHPAGMHTQDARTASFDAVRPPKGKKRTSNAKSKKAKFVWTLTTPSIEQLAQAGFFYSPTDTSDDNVTCFCCNSSLDQWEEGDDAFKEHHHVVPHCAWAKIMAIEKDVIATDDEHDPLAEEFLEARKATFGDSWPFEKEKGWVPKIQKLAEAGWHYFPSPESNDYTKCAYCSLCLDGWEPKDKPIEEHKKRSPGCAFFVLTDLHKKTRKKKARGSKSSRASVQSATATQDESVLDLSAQPEDSILTTATDLTTASTATTAIKKGGRAKKGVAKGGARSTRTKKSEEPSALEAEPVDEPMETEPPAKPTRVRGKKRSTAEMQIGELDEDSAAPPKKRAARTRNSTAQSVIDLDQSITKDATMAEDEPEELAMPKRGGKKRATAGSRATSRTASGTRKASARKASAVSQASEAPVRQHVLDEGEIDAILEADLERDYSDEDMPDAEPAAEPEPQAEPEVKPKSKRAPRGKAAAKLLEQAKETQSQDVLSALPDQPAEISKRSTKGATRKTSKATKANDAKESQDVLAAPLPKTTVDVVDDSVIITHTETVFKNHYNDLNGANDDSEMLEELEPEPESKPEPVPAKGKAKGKSTVVKPSTGKGKKSKAAKKEVEEITETPEPELQAETEMQPDEQMHAQNDDNELRFSSSFEHEPSILEEAEVPADLVEHFSPKKPAVAPKSKAAKDFKRKVAKAPKRVAAKQKETTPVESAVEEQPEVVEGSIHMPSSSPAQDHVESAPVCPPRSPRQTAPGGFPSPTPSPQSSNAENEQPSARPSHTRPPLAPLTPSHNKPILTRVPVAVEASTPTKSIRKERADESVSPQWALKSAFPWRPVDIETVFLGSPESRQAKWFGPANQDKENRSPFKKTAKDLQRMLTSPEKKMTVEEWIKANAEKGEEKLRAECERVVGQFESQGVRALQALEGLEAPQE